MKDPLFISNTCSYIAEYSSFHLFQEWDCWKIGSLATLAYLKGWQLCENERGFCNWPCYQQNPCFIVYILLHLLRLFFWSWWLRWDCEILENYPLNMVQIILAYSPCVKKWKRLLYIGMLWEKTTFHLENSSWFGGNSLSKLMIK